jgi:taurine dioxygenase
MPFVLRDVQILRGAQAGDDFTRRKPKLGDEARAADGRGADWEDLVRKARLVGSVVTPLEPFGVRIGGVDLSRSLGEADQAAFRELLFEHGVLVFEGQSLEDADQRRLMSYIGRVSGGLNGFTVLDPEGNLGRTNICFHSDYAFTEKPITALSLFGIDVEDGETCTRFADGAAGYERLPQALKARLAGRQALAVLPRDQGLVQIDQPIPEDMPSIVRDAVIDHPVTGRKIVYIHEMQCGAIVGLDPAEGRALAHEVYEHIYAEPNVYTHRWKKGDLVVWDNVGVHHARPPLDGVRKRSLRRIAVAEKELVELCPEYAGRNGPLQMLGAGKVVDRSAAA